MAAIPNSWIKKDKLPKVKPKAEPKEEAKHEPKLSRANMHGTLRGVRK
jgi:hypothetical protein